MAYDPNDPYRAVWAPSWRMVADPADPVGLALAGVHRAVRATREAATTTTSSGGGSNGEMQPIDGEGPWRTLTLEPG